jgi:tripartite-type tricarboxylate transporter receptor subunit TctC
MTRFSEGASTAPSETSPRKIAAAKPPLGADHHTVGDSVSGRARLDRRPHGRRALAAALALLAALVAGRPADGQPRVFEGKTVRIVVGFTAGGGFDTYSRAIARHLAKHLPGRPAVVVENMPGAASIIAANHAYKVAKPDGLTIVNFHGNQLVGQLLGREGIEFDARRFVWLGVPVRDNTICALTRASGIVTAEQWMAARVPVKLGGVGPGDTTHDTARILQAAGLPIQLVRGYKGTAEIRLAAESGEVAGGCWQWESVKVTWRKALDAGEIAIVLQVTEKPLAELPQVPLALDLFRSEEARQLLRAAVIVPAAISRLYALPPGTPADRVQVLRAAFSQTLRDPEFLADARQAKLEVDPVGGVELERLVEELFRLDPTVVAKLKGLLR